MYILQNFPLFYQLNDEKRPFDSKDFIRRVPDSGQNMSMNV